VIYAWIQEHRSTWPVRVMCRVLGRSVSGYYAYIKAPLSPRKMRREALLPQIHQAHLMSDGTYGSPRIAQELNARGIKVSENTIARYMREEGIAVRRRKTFVPQTTDSSHDHPIAPNRVQQDFTASGPNQKWVSDLTYIWTNEGWLYLSVVLDCYSRKVVGWSMSDDLGSDSVIQALQTALHRRRPEPGLIHHSDRGVQYACREYRHVLEEHGVIRSMSRSGNCYDNALAESFFASFKGERVNRRNYATKEQARSSVFEWIEIFYNRQRRHSSLGYVSPEAFEAQKN
jgi:putative transposase